MTTFVVQTSQSLQPDYAAMSASLLYESVLVQRAIANGSPVNSIAPSPLNPTIAFVPAATDIWVNGLWFTSLFLSLTTALVAVLVKQWLHHYVALPSGTPRDRSFTRQFRYTGFQKWHVQVIIGLLPVLMHLALAIFLAGLVVFLHPLRKSLSWITCAGTILVYTAYAVATILPIVFPQCPYRTPLCDLVYIPFCRLVPQVSWDDKWDFLFWCRRGSFWALSYLLPHVQARKPQSLTMIESEVVKQTSTNLAAEALHWLFSASSNPTVQSIVIQSIGGLPMVSEDRLLALQGDNRVMDTLQNTLVTQCLQMKGSHEPVPGMELKLGRLLRSHPRSDWNPDAFYSSERIVEILTNGHSLNDREIFESVRSGTIFMDDTHSPTLPPRCWHLLMVESYVLDPLDPDNDHHTNMFPVHLCSTLLNSFNTLTDGLMQDLNSPLVLDFEDALPYFLDKLYDDLLPMFSEFVKDPALSEPSLPQSLRVFVAAIEFLLHRLSTLPVFDVFDTTIYPSLATAVQWIQHQTFSSQEATAVVALLEDILAPSVIACRSINPDWGQLCSDAILAYDSLTAISPSVCSLRGLRSVVDFMTIYWSYDDHWRYQCYQSDPACRLLTNLLARRIPVAFTAFRESQCLQFLGNHTFHVASMPLVSEYVAGIAAMQQGSDGAVDAEILQQHVGYLRDPHNRFAACSILATHDSGNVDRTAIQRDIMTLVQLCPRDAVWDECRRKLHDLVESDGGDFFSKQLVTPLGIESRRPLQADEIQVEKDNIRYAIHILDDFFDGRTHTGMVS